jgi:hypothetical protein
MKQVMNHSSLKAEDDEGNDSSPNEGDSDDSKGEETKNVFHCYDE